MKHEYRGIMYAHVAYIRGMDLFPGITFFRGRPVEIFNSDKFERWFCSHVQILAFSLTK